MSSHHISIFDREGVLVIPGLFEAGEVRRIARAISPLAAKVDVRRVLEKDGVTVRSFFAPHEMSEVGQAIARCSRMLGVAQQLLGPDLYVYQSKYNAKAAFGGDLWEWHQDYTFWSREDDVKRDTLVTAMLFLDEVTEQNSPLLVMPSSHKLGTLASAEAVQGVPPPIAQPWLNTHTASLKYKIPNEVLRRTADACGIRSIIGIAGTVCFFHSNLVHGSTINITPYGRPAIFVTYNVLENSPDVARRPTFIAARGIEAARVQDDRELREALNVQEREQQTGATPSEAE